MSPDDILSFAFDHSWLIFGTSIAAAVVVMVVIGRPRRWWKWVLDVGSVLAIVVSVAALWFFTSIAGALDRRLDSLTFVTRPGAAPQKIADLRGKVVLLNYWATWCGPCRHEIPAMNRVVEKYRGRDVVFLAVTDEDFPQIDKFLAKIPISATVARFSSRAPSSPVEVMSYGGRPTTLVIDREGHVRRRLIGARGFEEFDAAVRSQL